jgi:pyruvate/2-oxoglutarate dehydrogenase complex dihydrolipoamide dehydrogenase (E3) component
MYPYATECDTRAVRSIRTLHRVRESAVAHIERYDILVLGSGEAGKYIAWNFAKAGRRSAVVERGLIGGSCPNIACLPSKNIIYSARIAALCRRAAEFGVSTGAVSIDMKGVRRRKRQMVDDLIAVHRKNYASSGAELIIGEGRLVAAKTIEVRGADGGVRQLEGEHVILDVGTRSLVPDVPGLSEASPLTHVEALELDRVPEHLIVLGGGYVGLELAQPMRRFGARVTLLQRGPQIAPREDPDVAAVLMQQLAEEGINVVLNAQTMQVEGRSGSQVRVRVRTPAGERTIEGSDLLVATGRVPNTKHIATELAGVDLDERGYVKVNERLETTAPNVWAVGDCAGSPQFTHAGFDDFRIIRDNLNGGRRTTRDRLVPYCMFTDPELGRVGLNESEAQRAGIKYRVAKIPMTAVLRTRTLSEPRGFLKALVAADTESILGFTALGAEAGELIAVVQTAMLMGAPYPTLRDAMLTHPTIAEGLTVLFASEPSPVLLLEGHQP